MSKENLHNEIQNRSSLSREELNDHLSKKDSLNTTNLDDFEKEAIEGWENSGVSKAEMNRLDKRFRTSTNSWIIASMLTLILFLALYLIYSPINKTEIQTVSKKEKVTTLIEETDLYIAEKFDTLIENKIPIQKEIKEFREHQEEKQEIIQAETTTPTNPIEKLPLLEYNPPIKKVDLSQLKKKKIKEIYLSNFKLVDYRVIRSKPTIETKQLDLTGTSANKESKSIEHEEGAAIWRKIDIPYYDFLEKTMYTLDKNELKKCLGRLETILKTYPEDINAQFYSGFVFYNLEDYSNAEKHFIQATENEIINFVDEATWYLALTYEKEGEKSKSQALFESIAESSSYYSKLAKSKKQSK